VIAMTNWTKIFSIGATGTGNEQLDRPTAIALDKPFIWIADLGNQRILKWHLHGGDYVDSISSVYCYALCIVGDYLYVMDTGNDVIKQYNKHDLTLKRTSAAFSNLSDMIYWREYLYVVDDSANAIYKVDPNTLSIEATLQIDGVTDTYEAIAAHDDYLYLLTDAEYVYRITSNFEYDDRSVDLSSYMSSAYYLSAHDGYLFVTGNDANFVIIDGSLQFIADVTYDTDDWQSAFDVATLANHVMLAADFTGDQIVCIYAYDRTSGLDSGDTITFDDDWDFGDDVIIGGTEANLSTKDWVSADNAKRTSRYSWKRSES